jgi:hypothetical protein
MRPPDTMRRDGYVPPCIPTRAYSAPAGPGWVHEIKHDGYRLQVRREGDTVRLFTRRGYDWILATRNTLKVSSALGRSRTAGKADFCGSGRRGSLLLRRAGPLRCAPQDAHGAALRASISGRLFPDSRY